MSATVRPLFSTPPVVRESVFRHAGTVRFLPLIVSGGFFVFSFLWLVIGPLDWRIADAGLYVFVIACVLAIAGGYTVGVVPLPSFRLPRGRSFEGKVSRTPIVFDANKLVLVAGVLWLVLYIPTVLVSTGTWYPDVWRGLTDPGYAYAVTKYLNETSSPVIHYVRFIASPLLILLAPSTFFLWHRLSWVSKSLGLASIVGTVALAIAQAVNKGMADLTIYLCLFLVLYAASAKRGERLKRALVSSLAVIVVVLVFLSYYAINIQGRIATDVDNATGVESVGEEGRPDDKPVAPLPSEGGADDLDESDIRDVATLGMATEREGHPLFLLPSNLRASTLVISSYVTHGYKGLSLALAEGWTPTYGLGFSEFIRHNFCRFAGGEECEDAIVARTYSGKLDAAGWPAGRIWSTFFVHPASDVSFPGVVVLMGLIGLGFAIAWRDTVTRADPLAATVFYALCMLIFYLPANNQLFQGGENAVGFTVVLLVWILARNGMLPTWARRLVETRTKADPQVAAER